jgi:hypothetical protein
MWRFYTGKSKLILLFIVLLLVLIVFGLWYLGKTDSEQVLTPEQQAILEENQNISNMVSQAYPKGEEVANFEAGSVDKVYKTEDLIILKDISKVTVQKYSQDLKTAMSPISLIDQNPMALLLDAIDNPKGESAKKLLTTSGLYKTTVTQLLTTPVPTTATVAHLRLIHSLNELHFITLSMSQVYTEPLKATQAGEYFADTFKKLLSDFNFINKYFENSGIIFNDTNKIIFVDFTLE